MHCLSLSGLRVYRGFVCVFFSPAHLPVCLLSLFALACLTSLPVMTFLSSLVLHGFPSLPRPSSPGWSVSPTAWSASLRGRLYCLSACFAILACLNFFYAFFVLP